MKTKLKCWHTCRNYPLGEHAECCPTRSRVKKTADERLDMLMLHLSYRLENKRRYLRRMVKQDASVARTELRGELSFTQFVEHIRKGISSEVLQMFQGHVHPLPTRPHMVCELQRKTMHCVSGGFDPLKILPGDTSQYHDETVINIRGPHA